MTPKYNVPCSVISNIVVKRHGCRMSKMLLLHLQYSLQSAFQSIIRKLFGYIQRTGSCPNAYHNHYHRRLSETNQCPFSNPSWFVIIFKHVDYGMYTMLAERTKNGQYVYENISKWAQQLMFDVYFSCKGLLNICIVWPVYGLNKHKTNDCHMNMNWNNQPHATIHWFILLMYAASAFRIIISVKI